MAHGHLVRFPDVQDLGDRIRSHRTVLRISLVAVFTVLLATAWTTAGLNLAGYTLIYSHGRSMEPTFPDRSLLIGSTTAPDDIRVGDIVAFPRPSEEIPDTVHRVVAVIEQGERRMAIIKGDNSPLPDPGLIPLDGPVIRVGVVLPYLGWWFPPRVVWLLLAGLALLGAYYLLERPGRPDRELSGLVRNPPARPALS